MANLSENSTKSLARLQFLFKLKAELMVHISGGTELPGERPGRDQQAVSGQCSWRVSLSLGCSAQRCQGAGAQRVLASLDLFPEGWVLGGWSPKRKPATYRKGQWMLAPEGGIHCAFPHQTFISTYCVPGHPVDTGCEVCSGPGPSQGPPPTLNPLGFPRCTH